MEEREFSRPSQLENLPLPPEDVTNMRQSASKCDIGPVSIDSSQGRSYLDVRRVRKPHPDLILGSLRCQTAMLPAVKEGMTRYHDKKSRCLIWAVRLEIWVDFTHLQGERETAERMSVWEDFPIRRVP